MKSMMRILFCLAVLVLATSAFAQTKDIPTKDVDPPPTTAPGMNSCTSTKGCTDCAIVPPATSPKCAILPYRNGYCKCGYMTTGCTASGECKYIGG